MASYRGDELVPNANVVMDRRLQFDATPAEVWPWLVQLGKRRAGWYFPFFVERFIPRAGRGARTLLPQFQALEIGSEVPDWGPGDPKFRVVDLEPHRALIYLSLRDRRNGHQWPADDRSGPGVLTFSWALLLTDRPGGGTRLHIRLRMVSAVTAKSAVLRMVGGMFDWTTIVALRRGLAQRLADPGPGAATGAS